MFTLGRGRMFDWLRRNGRDMSDCNASPIQHLDRNDVLHETLLAVHVNYLGDKDGAILGRKKVSVAHCPRSHAYFRHQKFPFATLAKANVNVCLGTDSLATVCKRPREAVELNMFEEMRAFSAEHRRVSARNILQMATVNGARALGMTGQIGEISEGALADLIAIPLPTRGGDPYQAALHHGGPVTASMIDGQWAIAP
jgi:aminodeoxyfutalosine deaminase